MSHLTTIATNPDGSPVVLTLRGKATEPAVMTRCEGNITMQVGESVKRIYWSAPLPICNHTYALHQLTMMIDILGFHSVVEVYDAAGYTTYDLTMMGTEASLPLQISTRLGLPISQLQLNVDGSDTLFGFSASSVVADMKPSFVGIGGFVATVVKATGVSDKVVNVTYDPINYMLRFGLTFDYTFDEVAAPFAGGFDLSPFAAASVNGSAYINSKISFSLVFGANLRPQPPSLYQLFRWDKNSQRSISLAIMNVTTDDRTYVVSLTDVTTTNPSAILNQMMSKLPHGLAGNITGYVWNTTTMIGTFATTNTSGIKLFSIMPINNGASQLVANNTKPAVAPSYEAFIEKFQADGKHLHAHAH